MDCYQSSNSTPPQARTKTIAKKPKLMVATTVVSGLHLVRPVALEAGHRVLLGQLRHGLLREADAVDQEVDQFGREGLLGGGRGSSVGEFAVQDAGSELVLGDC